MSNIIRPLIGFKQTSLTVFIILSCLLVLPNPGAATVWTQVQLNGDGFGDSGNTAVTSMTSFGDSNLLIAGTSHSTTGQVWYYNGATWLPIKTDGFGDANNTSMPSMAASGGYLFVGTRNEVTGAEVWRYTAATGWTQRTTDGFGDANNTVATSMVITGIYLFVVTENSSTGAEVWELNSSTSNWTDRTPNWGSSNTAVRSMVLLAGYLYVGTENSSGAEVWRYNGTWERIQTGGFGDSNNTAVTSMTASGYLFVGTKNEVTGAELWMYNAGTWTQGDNGWDDGSGPNPNNTAALSMAVIGSYIYVGTENSNTGAEVWRSDSAWNWKKEGNGWDGDASNTAITSMCVNSVSGADMLCMGFLNQTTGSQVWRGKTYDNIQPAVDDSIAGSTVLVEAGTYNEETLQMKTGVDVVSTWIKGVDLPGDRPLITRLAFQTVVFGSGVSNCDLKGFRIQAVGSSSWTSTVYFTGNNSGITIEDCEIFGESQGHGILLNGRVSATIRGCTVRDHSTVGISGFNMMGAKWTGGTVVIEDTEVYNCGGWQLSGAGIRLSDSDSLNYPSLVTITNCRIHNNSKGGIRLDGLSQATIDGGNVIYDNGQGGIYLNNIAQATVENNTIDNNGYGGIRIVNVDTVTISNNEIKNHAIRAGIDIENNSAVTIGADLAASDPYAYGNDIHSNYAGIYFRYANSQPVVIRGNNIHSNSSRGGIRLNAALTGLVTITQNDIDSNNWGGISIQNNCTVVITKNNIHASTTGGGIHTGNDAGTFSGTPGGANLTIRHNKVHGNLNANRGGGIDVRHASGIIENNLVYKNARGGIRFGDYITEIKNNTVVNNGNAAQDRGGGIIYDDPTDNVSVNERPTGTCSTSPLIKNNIVAYSEKAGIRVGGNGHGCPADNPGYDYNLLYANYPWNDVFNRWNSENCGWPSLDDLSCTQQQYGGCGAYVNSGIVLNNPNDIVADPKFVDMDGDDYHLDTGAPPIGAGALGVDMGAYGGSDPMVDSEIPEL